MHDLPDFIDLPQNSEVTKVNQNKLLEDALNSTEEEQIRLLNVLFNNLNLLTIKQASDKLGITPNGVRSNREIIELGGKKYVKL